MKYHELNVTSHKAAKRVGRGIAGGQGKTAGRGTKGQGARTGSSKRPGFAGGQIPLMQKLPKLPGFRSLHPKTYTVYTDQLNTISGTIIDAEVLALKGFVPNPYVAIKLLLRGDVTKKIVVKVQAASQTSVDAVEKAGGTVELVSRLTRPARKSLTDKKVRKAPKS